MAVKNNYDIFAERGDAWDADERPVASRQTASGDFLPPRLSARAHIRGLRRALASGGDTSTNPVDKLSSATSSLDLDQYLKAGKAKPFSLRIAKERNLLAPSMTSTGKPLSQDSLLKARIALRAKLTKRTAVIKVR